MIIYLLKSNIRAKIFEPPTNNLLDQMADLKNYIDKIKCLYFNIKIYLPLIIGGGPRMLLVGIGGGPPLPIPGIGGIPAKA